MFCYILVQGMDSVVHQRKFRATGLGSGSRSVTWAEFVPLMVAYIGSLVAIQLLAVLLPEFYDSYRLIVIPILPYLAYRLVKWRRDVVSKSDE